MTAQDRRGAVANGEHTGPGRRQPAHGRDRRTHVAVAFMARAAVSPTFAAASSPQLKDHLTGLLRNADVPAATEQAEILLSAVDGMTVRILAGHLTPEAAAEALDAHLTRLGLS
ncbi:TetR family transcriptional regulator C-terminal domain-containing protein [Nocardia sp. NPDC127526]|uniref:TetR family transcriptional regulator C-terminal domain-containing protein n=1 Tax=Nocardia sp. NPDC127526 TaxID=3345393 RepID=UPI0036430D5C